MVTKLGSALVAGGLTLLLVSADAEAGRRRIGDPVKGSGKLVTQAYTFGGFDRIHAGGYVDVYVTVGESPSVELTIDENLLEHVEVEVRGKRLEFGSETVLYPTEGSRMDIRVPSLMGIAAAGTGRVEATGVVAEQFDCLVSGAGDLVLTGTADALSFRVAGAGSIDAGSLTARAANFQMSGAGNATVHVTESLTGTNRGGGTLEYSGNPGITDTNGTGPIIRK